MKNSLHDYCHCLQANGILPRFFAFLDSNEWNLYFDVLDTSTMERFNYINIDKNLPTKILLGVFKGHCSQMP